jgi:hypothetical protein
MLIDSYPVEDVFARVPEVAAQTDPVLKTLDTLLEDDQLYQAVRTDLGKRYRLILAHGRHSTPVEVILRLLLVKHLYGWSYEETLKRVADSLVLRWFYRVSFQTVPTKATLIRWTHTLHPETLHELNDRVVQLAVQAKVTEGRKLRLDGTCVQTEIHHRSRQWTARRERARALACGAASQRIALRTGQQRAATLPFSTTYGPADRPNLAPPTPAQGRRQGSRAEEAVSKAGGDHRADGATSQKSRESLEQGESHPDTFPEKPRERICATL